MMAVVCDMCGKITPLTGAGTKPRGTFTLEENGSFRSERSSPNMDFSSLRPSLDFCGLCANELVAITWKAAEERRRSKEQMDGGAEND